MNKRLLSILLIAFLSFSLIACGDNKDTNNSGESSTNDTTNKNDKVRYTEEEAISVIKDLLPKLQEDLKDHPDIDVYPVKIFKRDAISIGNKNRAEKLFTYKDISTYETNYIEETTERGGEPAIKFSGYYSLNLKDFVDKKVDIKLEDTIIPIVYKYLQKGDLDLTQFNEELNEGSRLAVQSGGDQTYLNDLIAGDLILEFLIAPFGDDTLSISYSVFKYYKD